MNHLNRRIIRLAPLLAFILVNVQTAHRTVAASLNPALPQSRSDRSIESTTHPAKTTTPIATRRPFTAVDQAKPGSSFYQFRQQLQQAVQRRDANFIRSIAAPNIRLTFGTPITLNDLDIDNPNALFWRRLERIISTGCAPYEAPANAPATDAWVCPHVAQAALGDPFTDVYIVGEGVNVRARPELNSSVVGVVSNEVVAIDQAAYNAFSDSQRIATETLSGWFPIVTSQGQRGYVSSRYAYLPAGHRARFERIDNRWQMTIFITGD